MSPGRRPTPHRLRRDPREVAIAVACALAVLLVTAALLWVLAPSDDEPAPSTPPISLPTQIPETQIPDTAVPDPAVPDSGSTDPAPGETSTTVVGG